MTPRRIVNAALGLGLGLVTLPLAFVIWPAFCMWFFYNETDVDGADEEESDPATYGEGGPENG
jgi:hypothetical protein